MLSIAVSVGRCFEFDYRGALGQVQAFGELICNSENLEADIFNVHNFTAPIPRPKPNIIPTSKIIRFPYGVLWRLWYGRNMGDWNLDFYEWYEIHIKPHIIQSLYHQEDPMCHSYHECAPP